MAGARRIYFDHNATTRIAPEVRVQMAATLDQAFGNPSSLHETGRIARELCERARREVSALLGGASEGIVFTSGGTEANQLAVVGAARSARAAGRPAHVVSSAVEQAAVVGACAFLRAGGFALTVLPVDDAGLVDPDLLARAVREGAALVTIQLANHETGTLQALAELARVAHAHAALVHTDA